MQSFTGIIVFFSRSIGFDVGFLLNVAFASSREYCSIGEITFFMQRRFHSSIVLLRSSLEFEDIYGWVMVLWIFIGFA